MAARAGGRARSRADESRASAYVVGVSERIVTLMEDAERLLEPPHDQEARFKLSRFHELCDRGELEAAWDEIAGAGELSDTSVAFWRNLADAAGLLGLDDRRADAARRARPPR